MLDLGPIKARLAAATPGPLVLRSTSGDTKGGNIDSPTGKMVAYANTDEEISFYGGDAAIFLNASTDIADLITEVERLRAAV